MSRGAPPRSKHPVSTHGTDVGLALWGLALGHSELAHTEEPSPRVSPSPTQALSFMAGAPTLQPCYSLSSSCQRRGEWVTPNQSCGISEPPSSREECTIGEVGDRTAGPDTLSRPRASPRCPALQCPLLGLP